MAVKKNPTNFHECDAKEDIVQTGGGHAGGAFAHAYKRGIDPWRGTWKGGKTPSKDTSAKKRPK